MADFYCPEQHLHPTQLYAAGLGLLAFIGLALIYRRKSFDGQIIYWWIIYYTLYRFVIEFFRFSPIHWAGLTPSQWLAALILGATLAGAYYFRRQRV
ncbi:hypothetical protein A2311_05845 [candidate division WOR-1 bacterium RIFOXYB2_FULL_48_7]|uniref:Prolipoprotein diacylglyceryl transferase n=1 Tax=candidate division WOR-1 bacterium RIFOXYB2_FULL_48_7 TaxID=1802583 RepID=A0A1F4TWM4_UNCSA|nr:MAG: hypothetical protein A2311_05845 [candidate division WOR-1 bacterium RIFOXYB2_FULL_48_7]